MMLAFRPGELLLQAAAVSADARDAGFRARESPPQAAGGAADARDADTGSLQWRRYCRLQQEGRLMLFMA